MNNEKTLNKDGFKSNLISRINLKNDFFESEKRQQMLNLLFKYSKNSNSVELRHMLGFIGIYGDELISIYKKKDISSLLHLFNFGEDFNNGILQSSQEEEYKKIRLREEKEKKNFIQQKEFVERMEKERNELREKYILLFNQLFQNNDVTYQQLSIFLEDNKHQIQRCFDFPLTVNGVCSYLKVSKELKNKIIVEQKIEKERIKEEKHKHKQKLLEEHTKRLNYLGTLGLSEEVLITQSTLKNIFTDKVIETYLPTPYSEARNPNLSKNYQNRYGLTMKLYRMADVIEIIKTGVKPRIKSELKEEYKKILSFFILDLELKKNTTNKKIVSKI